jgi:hypothetical protein
MLGGYGAKADPCTRSGQQAEYNLVHTRDNRKCWTSTRQCSSQKPNTAI